IDLTGICTVADEKIVAHGSTAVAEPQFARRAAVDAAHGHIARDLQRTVVQDDPPVSPRAGKAGGDPKAAIHGDVTVSRFDLAGCAIDSHHDITGRPDE